MYSHDFLRKHLIPFIRDGTIISSPGDNEFNEFCTLLFNIKGNNTMISNYLHMRTCILRTNGYRFRICVSNNYLIVQNIYHSDGMIAPDNYPEEVLLFVESEELMEQYQQGNTRIEVSLLDVVYIIRLIEYPGFGLVCVVRYL